MLKLLVHVGSGYAIYYRRLSRGTFQLPPINDGQAQVGVEPATLTLMLEGIDLRSVKRRLRHIHQPKPKPEN